MSVGVWLRGLAFEFAIVVGVACGGADGECEAAGGVQFFEELLLEGCCLLLEGGYLNEVMAFVGIGLQIVEAIQVPETVVVDVFPAVGADGESGRGGGEVPFPVVFVEDMVTPGGGGGFALQQGQERWAVEAGGVRAGGGLGEFEQGGSNVDIQDHVTDD